MAGKRWGVVMCCRRDNVEINETADGKDQPQVSGFRQTIRERVVPLYAPKGGVKMELVSW